MSPSTEQRENRELASEIKFLVSLSIAEQILGWARSRLAPDPHSSTELQDGYHISSLYFDTTAFDVFHRKGSFGRSKYRVRKYGTSDVAFLERKLKTRGLVSKRRSLVRLNELGRLLNGESNSEWSGYWYCRRLAARRLAPVCQIDYKRNARVSMTDHGPIRLTIDVDVHALTVNGLGFVGDKGKSILEHQAIVELKYRCQMPVLFKLLIEEFALSTQALSKYRLAASTLGLVSPAALAPGGGAHSQEVYA